MLSIVQELPVSLIDHHTLSKVLQHRLFFSRPHPALQMCHLLTDPSLEVQKMTYSLLTQAAKKRTEHVVIEAAMDTTDQGYKAELPLELLAILQQTIGLDGQEEFPYEQVERIFQLFSSTTLNPAAEPVWLLPELECLICAV